MDNQKFVWGMGWTRLTLDRDKWQAVANAIIDIRVP